MTTGLDPETVVWDEVGADGTKYALLEGRRDRAGEGFVYAFWLPAGFWDPPHWHSSDAHVTVVRGALELGYGEGFDPAALERFEQGSEVVVPAEARHFDGARVDTLIVGRAVGVWATHYVDPRHEGSAGTLG